MGILDGKVALITGAGKGIGRATAVLFAKEGAMVVVTNRSEENGLETLRMIKEAGREGVFTNATKCAAIDYGDTGLRINCIAPGTILTEGVKGLEYIKSSCEFLVIVIQPSEYRLRNQLRICC